MKKAIVVDLSQIDAILLAAGASKRLGEPKALVDIHGESLIKLIIRKLKQNDLRIIIVTRKELVEEINKLGEKIVDKNYDGNIKNAYQDLVKEALGDDVPDSIKGSVSKLQKVHSMIVNKMKSFAKMYKEKGGDHIFKSYSGEENKVIDILKDLNDKKKKVEDALDKKVSGIGRNQQLAETPEQEDAVRELRDIVVEE